MRGNSPTVLEASTLLAKLPQLRKRVGQTWCVNYYEPYRKKLTFLDALTRSVSPNIVSALCPNPGTSGYTCEAVRFWRTLVPPVVSAMRELSIAPAWAGSAGGDGMNLYTFGVFFGDSLYFFRREYPKAQLLGFDSFTGLPAEKPGEVKRRGWVPGTFNTWRPHLVIQRLREDLGGRGRTFFERGFFNASLTPQLARSLGKAAIIDIDSDIYVSAYQALDWIFTHGLAGIGTLVVYDDWMDYACGPRVNQSIASLRGGAPRQRKAMREAVQAGRFGDLFSAGEPKAHREIARKHSVDFRCVAGACGRITSPKGQCDVHGPFGAVFVIAGFGIDVDRDSPDAGVENSSPAELAKWRAQNRGCAFVMREKYTVETNER